MSEFSHATYTREDPRLTRQGVVCSPEELTAKKSPSRDPRIRSTSTSSWDNSVSNSYGTQQQHPMQTAYQHLQPGNMYNNANQYPNQSYYAGYGNYSYDPYSYQTGQQQQPYMSGGVQPGPPGEEYPQGGWAPVTGHGQGNPPADYGQNNAATNAVDAERSEAVAEELKQQKANLIKERDTYEERVASLTKKLDILVKQKEDLSSKRSPDSHIMRENTKLQAEIQSKIKDANNVIEILTNLIRDKQSERESKESSKSKKSDEAKTEKVNYNHYDPGIHWCRMCDIFPRQAKDLLMHLHCKKHQETTAQDESPWRKLPPEPKFPTYEGAPVRKLPIKGLQFFVASTAWYCRLCDSWMGDLHCASQHLMSVTHSQNYSHFVEQNPAWEIEWMKDREKALERMKRTRSNGSDSEDKKKRRKRDKYSPTATLGKDKKKKKRKKRSRRRSSDSSSSSSSSSSSDDEEREDKSKSIRVAMRNKMKMLESDGKWDILGKLVEERKRTESTKESPTDDKLMSQWMTISEPPDKDKYLLDNLKEKLKQKHDAEKAKIQAELEAAQREKEREEYEKKQKEKRELELIEREEDKHREKMTMRLKEQVNIRNKPSTANYRRHRSPSPSPDRSRHRKSRSTSSERRSRSNRRSFDESPHMRYSKENHKEKHEDEKREKKPPVAYKKLPFIGRMPLFKNSKGKKPEEEKKEIQKEDYDIPRKTRFQPGNLARAFIPEPEVVCFPKLSTYPPIPPPPPALTQEPPEPPKISVPKPPPPPKIDLEQPPIGPSIAEDSTDDKQEPNENNAPTGAQDDYNLLYEDSSNTMIYPYGNMDYNMMYQNPQPFNFMQVAQTPDTADIPRSHTMPLQPPPLPPDDPNDDLAMLGISSDDMAVQSMF